MSLDLPFKYMFFDTNILSELAKGKGNIKLLQSYMADNNIWLALSASVLGELRQLERKIGAITDVLIRLPCVFFDLDATLIRKETEAYPEPIVPPFHFHVVLGPILNGKEVTDLYTEFETAIRNPDLLAARMDQLEKAEIWIKNTLEELSLLREDFISDDKAKNQANAENYAMFCIFVKLGKHHRDFLLKFQEDASQFDYRKIKALYLRYLFLYFKYYLNNSQPKVSDFGDLANIGLFEYCNIVVVERNAYEYLSQIKKKFPILQNTELYNISFMREKGFL